MCRVFERRGVPEQLMKRNPTAREQFATSQSGKGAQWQQDIYVAEDGVHGWDGGWGVHVVI